MRTPALLLSLSLLLCACADTEVPSAQRTATTFQQQAACAGGPFTPIAEIQGSGAASPLLGQTVTVQGLVTADFQAGIGGFFIQDPNGDDDPQTSDGIFVYTGKTPQTVAVGDLIKFSGQVKEYKGTADKQPDTLTQLDTITELSNCGTSELPAPVTIEAPFDELEAYESMLVRFNDTLTVTNNYTLGRYGELGLSTGGRIFVPTNGNARATGQGRLITLDDGSTKQNPPNLDAVLDADHTRRAGDTVTGLTGILRYANDAYKLEATVPPLFVKANPRPGQPTAVGGSLKVAGANVLNYFTTFGPNDRGADSDYEFQRQKKKVVAALKGLDADIVTLMEVQNNEDIALNDLVTALNAAYGSAVYQAVQTGRIGSDAIKVAMLYKPSKVQPVGSFVTDTASVHSRPPLAQLFREQATGGRVIVIANHFKSKGSCPDSGDVDTGQGCWNQLRVQQAQRLITFADELKTQMGEQNVLLMGDLNAYGAEDPIKTLEQAGYLSLNQRIPAEERYSFQFNGQFGYLDHALASPSLGSKVAGITEWHINADEPAFIDYNVEFKQNPECKSSCTSPDFYAPNAFRSSDHDPVLVGLSLQGGGSPSEKLVISQVYGGGGNSGAPYTHDFIEVFNAGQTTINLAKYSVQYTSTTGQSWNVTPLANVNLAPGQYYLVREAKGNGGAQALPTPDAQGTVNLSASAGQVLLAAQTTPVSRQSDPSVRDYVKYSGLKSTTSASRAGGGCTDTDHNGDFTAGTVQPRTTASTKQPCP